jgi:hypothetical protein
LRQRGNANDGDAAIEPDLRNLNADQVEWIRTRKRAGEWNDCRLSAAARQTIALFENELESRMMRSSAGVRQQFASDSPAARKLNEADLNSRAAVKQRPEGAWH